jgi:hypothetical protein
MTRFALVLAAILLLVYSAGSTHTQLRSGGAVERAGQALIERQARAASAGLALAGEQGLAPNLAPSADDRPAPALLVYLALVLAGSVVSVALVRRGLGREI